MIKFYLPALLFCALVFPACSGQSVLDSVGNLLVSQEYDAAEKKLAQVLSKNPHNIDALYLRVASRQTRLLDYEAYGIGGDEFIDFADSAIAVFEQHLNRLKGRARINCLFYLGNTHGSKGLIHGKNAQWVAAVKSALASLSYLDRVLKKDKQYLAAYLGKGIFDYYLGTNLRWVLLGGNRIKQGVNYVTKATGADYPFNIAAKNSLCWILIEQEEYDRVDSLVNTVLQKYPENSVFLRIKANLHYRTHNWRKAKPAALDLLKASLDRQPTNWSDLTSAYLIAIKSFDHFAKKDSVLDYSHRALRIRLPEHARTIPYVNAHLDEIKAISGKYGR
ncbi:MAG: hypothetical protein GF398_06840 [Chitinivibrionales bacterium]|nr:hypothetical protein [Chitinivibrionales bacterium]